MIKTPRSAETHVCECAFTLLYVAWKLTPDCFVGVPTPMVVVNTPRHTF